MDEQWTRRPWTVNNCPPSTVYGRGLSLEFLARGKFDALVGAVVDADAFVLDDAVAEHGRAGRRLR